MSGKLLILSVKWVFRHKLWFILCALSFSTIAILLGIGFAVKAGNEKQISSYTEAIYITVEPKETCFSLEEVTFLEQHINSVKTYLVSRGGFKVCAVNKIDINDPIGFPYMVTEKDFESECVEVDSILVSQVDFCEEPNDVFEVKIEIQDGEKRSVPAKPTFRKESDAYIYWYVPWDFFMKKGNPICRVDFLFDTNMDKENATEYLHKQGYIIDKTSQELTNDEKIAKAVRYISALIGVLMYVLAGLELYIIVSSIIVENRSYLLVLKMLGIKKTDYNKLIMGMSLVLSLSGALIGCITLAVFKAALPFVINFIAGELLVDFGGRFVISVYDYIFIITENIVVAVMTSVLVTVKENVSFERVK